MNISSKSPKPQELQRQQADFARRVKELDAREEYLTEREQILESGPHSITVLEETIRAKEEQLKKLKRQVELHVVEQDKVKRRLEIEIDATRVDLDDAHKELTDIQEAVGEATEDYESVVAKQNKLEKDIQERTTYLIEQEALIAETIDEGNAALRGIGYEVKAAQEQHDNLKTEIAALETRKTDISYELIQIEERSKQDEFQFSEQLEALQHECGTAKENLSKVKAEHKVVIDGANDKLRKLGIKEQELLTKQRAIERERQELDEEKRRWHSTKALYGV